MGIWFLIVTLLITSAASLEEKCLSNILNKFLSDPSKTKAEYGNGETISVTCLAGSGDSAYEYYSSDNYDNSVVLTCADGKWIGHYPECFTNCSRPDIFAVLHPDYDLYAPGDIVTVQACKKDNAPIEGNTTFTCMADGTWTGSARCPKQQKSCIEQPPSIANAYVTGEVLAEYRHGTVLRYKCSQAFDQTGRHSATCQDGRWSQDTPKLPLCTIGRCSPIYDREIDNGHVKNIVGEVGTYAEFECYDGYELEGSARILCMSDRKWNPEIPRCKPVSCPAPKQPSHGRLAQEAYNGVLNIYQSIIRYDCNKGYRLVGPQFRKCQGDRTWSGNDTKCEEIVCEKPSSPENGKVYLTDNSEKVGSQIEYICDEHHIMEPSNSQFAICTEQGYWSRPKPLCIKSCKVSILANGELRKNVRRGETITKDTYVPTNTQLIFSCWNRFEMYAGGYVTDGRLNCADGSLLPGIPECRPRRCWIEKSVNLEYFIGAQKVSDSYIDSETELRARCPDWMELVRLNVYLDTDQASVKCSMGTLEPQSLDCKDKRCNITGVENGHFKNREKEVSSGERIDSRDNIRLICSGGYELYNESTYKYLESEQTNIQCFQGSFTARIPTCKLKRCQVVSSNSLLTTTNVVEHGNTLNVSCPNTMELHRARHYLNVQETSVSCSKGTWIPELPRCINKRCSVAIVHNGRFNQRGDVVPSGNRIGSDETILLQCENGYELYDELTSRYLNLEQMDIKCDRGSFAPNIPLCKQKRCKVDTARRLSPKIATYSEHGANLIVNCSDEMELFHAGQYLDKEQTLLSCNKGTWNPDLPQCINKRCSVVKVDDGQFNQRGDMIPSGEKIGSDETIHFKCKNGYELYDELTSRYLNLEQMDIKCDRGFYAPNVPLCKPKRCKVDTSRRLLPKISTYSEDGVKLIVNCSDEMELFRAGQYLDEEKTLLSCNKGTWNPDLPQCINKRCIVPTIDNGRSRKSATILQPGEKIASGEKAQLECFEGYELHNGTYIDSDRTDIECNKGSFIETIPTCKDKRCRLKRLSNILPQISFTESGSSLNVSCPDNMELIDTGVSQNREVAENGESVNKQKLQVFCNKGTWKPDLPHCSFKRCKLPDLVGEITGFIVTGTKTKPEEFVQHDQSIETVCREGYRQQGFLTCNGGFWTGDSTCQLEICDKPAFEYIILNQGILANDERGFSHGTILTAFCESSSKLYIDDVRLKRKENTTTECIHGEWKPKFSCKKKCTLPQGTFKFANPMYQKEDKKEGDRIQHGRFVMRACPPKYEESRSSKCSDGIWDPPFTDCAKDIVRCQIFNNTGMNFTSLRNNTVGVGGNFEKGDKILVSCTSGYKTTIFAEPEYDYDNNYAEVTADPVGAPEARGSQKPSPDSNGTYTCGDSGDWEPKIRFTCEKIVCDPLDDNRFENGKISYSSREYTVGTIASFMCDPDYNITGSKDRVCQEDGTWSNPCVTCQNNKRNASTTCLAPCVPDGAKKTGSYTYEVGSRVEFQCLASNTQYSGDSSNIRQCIITGGSASWTGTHINCKGVGDVLLRTIAGELEGEWGNLSRALGFQYEELIVAPDEPSRNALKILQYWRDSVVRNKPRSLIPQLIVALEKLQKRNAAEVLRSLNGLQNVRCMRPGLNGTITPNRSEYQFGESVTVSSCNDGYMLVNQGYLVCSENKTWFGNSTCRYAVCNPDCGKNKRCVRDNECQCAEGFSGKTCDQEVILEGECEPLADQHIVIQTGVVLGKLAHKTVEIQCNAPQAPFNDVGQAECKKGYWFPLKPTCQNTCTLPSVPGAQYSYNITRTTVLPGLISSGRRIQVTCESAYFPSLGRSDVSICKNGVWEPELTSCEKIASCAIPNISDVIVQPSKERYAVNETVALTGCQKGLGLVGAKSLLCGTDGLWSGHAQCISHCGNGKTYWQEKNFMQYNGLAFINAGWVEDAQACLKLCDKYPICRAVNIEYGQRQIYCRLLRETTSSNPRAFSKKATKVDVLERECNDECVVSMDFNEISLYNGDSPYDGGKVQNGIVLSIKCKVPGLTPVPDQVTCMGGKWNYPTEKVSCLP